MKGSNKDYSRKMYMGTSPGAKALYEERKALNKTTKIWSEGRNRGYLVTLNNLRVTVTEINTDGSTKVIFQQECHYTMAIYMYCKMVKEHVGKGYDIVGKIDEDVEPKKRRRKKKDEDEDEDDEEEDEPEEEKIQSPKHIESKPSLPNPKKEKTISKRQQNLNSMMDILNRRAEERAKGLIE